MNRAIFTNAGRLAQLVRASRSHREGHPFKSDIAHLEGKVLRQVAEDQTQITHKDCTALGAIFIFTQENWRKYVN